MDRLGAMHFTRDPGPLALLGFRVQSQETLQLEMDRAGLNGSWVVADLSLGAWRGHQVAREFCMQLEVDLPHIEIPTTEEMTDESNTEIAYADIIGEFIDSEAQGDQAVISSLRFASLIREKVLDGAPRVFLLMAPRFEMAWERENIFFVRILTQALKGTRCVLVLIASGESDPDTPLDWKISWRGTLQAPPATASEDIVGLVPGVIGQELADALRGAGLPERADLIPLSNGHWLVPVERRRHPEKVSRLEFDRLGTLVRTYGWLDAYSQFYGNRMYVEPWFLYAEGRRRFAEGGTGITLRLMERAIEHVRMGMDWGVLQSYAQGLRVALHRFADAADIVDPPTSLPPGLRSFLVQCKGWGLVMLGEVPRAEEYFRQALELTDPTSREHREYLYLLNISALCSLKGGDIENAFSLEQEIEERRERLSRPDRRLDYVNSINIARLHRRRGELEQAEQHYRNAFATTLGVRTESDSIYVNVILAKLHTDSGSHATAFTFWMRAGLHWAASDAPEAIGGRIVRHILGKRLEPGTNLTEAISASLSASILAAGAASGIAEVLLALQCLTFDGSSAPVFVRTEFIQRTQPHAAIDRALLSSGFSIFATQNAIEPHIIGKNFMRLRVILYTLLEALAPFGFLSGSRTIVVDNSFGREIPATREELVVTCIRLDVRVVAMEGDVMVLTADMGARIERCLRPSLSRAVESVVFHEGSAVVFFNRYLPPIVLTVEETRLLAVIENDPTVDVIVRRCKEIGSRVEVLQILRQLEQKRVVYINPPQPNDVVAEYRRMKKVGRSLGG